MTDQERELKVEKTIEKASPAVKEKVLKDFKRMKFTYDWEFQEYLAETSAMVDFKEESAKTSKSSVINANGPVDLSKVSPSVKSFIDSKKTEYEDPLGGKSGSEDPYTR